MFNIHHQIIAGIALKSVWPEWGLLELERSCRNVIGSSGSTRTNDRSGTGQRCNFWFSFAILRSIKLQININGSVYICNKTQIAVQKGCFFSSFPNENLSIVRVLSIFSVCHRFGCYCCYSCICHLGLGVEIVNRMRIMTCNTENSKRKTGKKTVRP